MTSCTKALLILSLISRMGPLNGQFYTQGEDPAAIRWEKIRTENFRLIYPRGLYAETNRFANLLEHYRPYTSYSLNNKPGAIPVIIHNRSVNSNGFVSWAPKRMEVVALPDQGNFAQDWFEQLALHEYRHVVQVDKFRQGLTKKLSWLFGEIAAGAASAYMPRWFLEGDAVVIETAGSSTGRGRLPSFDMELRTAILDTTRKFSYDQAFMGTFKYYVPDYYQYGYHMVSYARMRFGAAFWEGAINYSARRPYLLAPLSLYSLKHTGLNRAELYNNAMDSVRFVWEHNLKDPGEAGRAKVLSKKSGLYRQYRLPQSLPDKSIIALKSGIDLLDQIVRIDSTGKETKLHITGTTKKLNLSACADYIIWDEIVIDPRWNGRSFSVIKSFDIREGKEKQITKRTRYFSPDISNDETKIVVIETDIENQYYLVILQYPGGKIIKRIPSPENKVLQFPEWIDAETVVLISFDGTEKRIETVDVENGHWKTLYRAETMDVAEPVPWRKHLLFRASYGGIENIFAVSPEGRLHQVTCSDFGAFHPSVTADMNHLVYSDYTAEGFEICRIPLDTTRWIPVEPVPLVLTPWADKLKQQEMLTEVMDKNNFRQYKPVPFIKSSDLFRFHSWLPFFMNLDENNLSIDFESVRPGIMLFSQNLLSTAFSTLSYRFEDGYHIFRPSFTFRGWYPVFSFSAELGGPLSILTYPEDRDLPDNLPYRKKILSKTYIPLFFNKGKYRKFIQPQLEYEWSNTLYYSGIFKTGLSQIHFRFYAYRYLRSSLRDLYPKWGQFLTFTYTDTPADDEQFGKIWSARLDLYFPGILNHHSWRFNAGYQQQLPQKFYLPVNRITFPRGYPVYIAEEFTALSTNYSFPFLYPDLSMSWLLFVKRLTANVFYDLAYGYNIREVEDGIRESFTGIYSSTGIELYMDINLFRIIFPVRAGIRYSYLPLRKSQDIEFLITVDTGIF